MALLAVAAAEPSTRPAPPAYYSDPAGVALHGYDVVAYFDEKAVAGQPEFTAKHEGLTFLFSSKANLDKFVAAPAQYLPQYGGYCAFGMTRGYKAPTDPKAFTIHNGKLYLNYSMKVVEGWKKTIDQNIAKADQNWPAAQSKDPIK